MSSDQIGSAFLYGTVSSTMAFLNKEILSSYNLNFPFILLLCQMLVAVLFIQGLRTLKVVSLPPYTLSRGLKFWLPSLCSALHSVLSLFALKGMNIPMYAAIKRCTPLVNLLLAIVLLRKPIPSCFIILSVLLITCGCLIAGAGDYSFELQAYLFGGLSVIVQGFYQTLIQKASEEEKSSLEIFQLNSYNCVPFFFFGSLFMLETSKITEFPYLKDIGFLSIFLLVICVGATLNYSLFLCTSLNSALTTSLIGVMKSMLQTVAGYFMFGGVTYHPLNVLGLVINTIGGFLYTYGKYKEYKHHKKTFSRKNKANGQERDSNV